MRKFIPRRERDNIAWLNHYVVNLPAVAKLLGTPLTQVTAFQKMLKSLNDSVPEADAARAASKKASDIKQNLKDQCNNAVSDLESMMQTSELYTDAIRKELGTDSTSPAVNAATIKPKLKVRLVGGGVQLRIIKYGAKSVTIYVRLQGEDKFVPLERISGSVYIDKRPLNTPGVAEIRQYQIRVIVGDEEVGYFSDIVTISFGG